MITSMDELLQASRKGESVRVAVAAADDEAALSAMIAAASLRISTPLLFGDEKKITTLLQKVEGGAGTSFEIRHVPDENEAAVQAVAAIRNGEAQILLKGKIKTALLLKAVVDSEKGLRLNRLLSDVFLFENVHRSGRRLMIITDGGVTLKPDLKQKLEIIENAVFVMHTLGIALPKVALLSAVETVNPSLPSTLDAAIITKMNHRGQIKGCIIDGPLALDNAVSPSAARTKELHTPIAGQADILVCPDIESANMLAKSTCYFAGFRLGHVMVGAAAPVLIPSRADNADSKLLSVALGKVVGQYTA